MTTGDPVSGDPEQVQAWLDLARDRCLQGNAEAAASWLADRVDANPESVPLHAMLGDVHLELGDVAAAAQTYRAVLASQPQHPGARAGLAHCLARRPGLVLQLDPDRRPADLVLQLLSHDDADADLLAGAVAVALAASPSPLDEPLLMAALHRVLLTDLSLERLLTGARRELCLAPPPRTPELAAAIAAQCRRNGYVWAVGDAELGCLADAPGWVSAMYLPAGTEPDADHPRRRIRPLTPIATRTSAAVREQYEQNPYPQWDRLPTGSALSLDDHLRLLTAGGWQTSGGLRRPDLLVAGCGTGRDLLRAARAWDAATATGLDLSLASLDHAQRMAHAYGIPVELHQADLLLLGDWDQRFDVIVCTGVLHHLDDPIAGWRVLLDLLRPGGVMLVGLYSQTARRGIVAAQRMVRDLGLPATPEGIRAIRAHLAGLPVEHPARASTRLPDFFYASGCRDMLCHVREHRFTIPGIAAALDDLGLQFVAFELDGAVRRRHRALFGRPDDLASWERFERLYPDTFLGMYQFWCRRRDPRPGHGDSTGEPT